MGDDDVEKQSGRREDDTESVDLDDQNQIKDKCAAARTVMHRGAALFDYSLAEVEYSGVEKRVGVVLLVASLVLSVVAAAFVQIQGAQVNNSVAFMNKTLQELTTFGEGDFSYFASGTELSGIGNSLREDSIAFLATFDTSQTDLAVWLVPENPLVQLELDNVESGFSAVALATLSIAIGLLLYLSLHMIPQQQVLTWVKATFYLFYMQMILCVIAAIQGFLVFDRFVLLAVGTPGFARSHNLALVVQWILTVSLVILLSAQIYINVKVRNAQRSGRIPEMAAAAV